MVWAVRFGVLDAWCVGLHLTIGGLEGSRLAGKLPTSFATSPVFNNTLVCVIIQQVQLLRRDHFCPPCSAVDRKEVAVLVFVFVFVLFVFGRASL